MSPDPLVALGQATLALLALAMLVESSTCVSRAISAPTALALVAVSVGLLMLSAPISAAIAAICAAAWLGIFTIRGRDPNRPR